jgi:hypothetical protein
LQQPTTQKSFWQNAPAFWARRSTAAAAIEAEPTIQFGNLSLLSFNQRLQRGVLRQHFSIWPTKKSSLSPAGSGDLPSGSGRFAG